MPVHLHQHPEPKGAELLSEYRMKPRLSTSAGNGVATAATAAFTAAVAPAGEFAGQEPDGEEEGEVPEWDPSGSYDEEAEEGQWQVDGEDPNAHLPPTEEELAEAEILRQGKVRAVCWP